MVHIVRFLRGTVSFEIKDSYPERIINLLTANGICVFNIKRFGGGFCGHCYTADEERLKKLLKKSGTEYNIGRSAGFLSQLSRIKHRTGAVIGIVLLLLMPFFLRLFIVDVEIIGNTTIPTESLAQFVHEVGLKKGAYIKNIDTAALERKIITNFKAVGWAAVNITGSNAVVEIRERTLPPKIRDDKLPHNVIAKESGHIISFEAYEGQPQVKLGDSVVKGEMLISGIMQDHYDKSRLVHAKGKIIAVTEDEILLKVSKKQVKLKYCGIKDYYELKIKNLFIRPYGNLTDKSKKELTIKRYSLFGLPITITKGHQILYDEVVSYPNISELIDIGKKQLAAKESVIFKDISHNLKDLTVTEEENFILFAAKYECKKDIAEEVPILTMDK